MGNRITNIFAGIDKAEPYHTHNGYPMGSDSNNHSGEVAPGQQRDDICMRKSPHSLISGM